MMEAATNPVNRTGTRKPELLTKDEQVVGAQSPDFHGKIGNPWEAVTFQPAKNHPQPTDLKGKIGAPGRIRTCDRRFRRPVLYPAELRAHAGKNRMRRYPYGRGRGIRTPDILLPKQTRYQTALYPEVTRPRTCGRGRMVRRRPPQRQRRHATCGSRAGLAKMLLTAM